MAAYRDVNAALGDEDAARDLVKTAMLQNHKTFGEWMNRPLLWFSRDPVTLLSRLNLKKWSR